MGSQKGAFIVLEGSDGSGKTTQFELLTNRLKKQGYDVATFSFPQYDEPSSYFVREYLKGTYGNVRQVGPYTAALFYALDRYQVAPKIRQAVEEGKVVVASRFTGSNMAHQGAKFANPEERRGYFIWLDNLESVMLQIPRPDRSIVLRVPLATSQQLMDKQGKERDIHEQDEKHLDTTVEVFDDLCRLFPKDFVRLDCVRNDKLLEPKVISDMVWGMVEPLLPPREPVQSAAPPVMQSTETPTQEATAAESTTSVPLLTAIKASLIAPAPDPIRLTTPKKLPTKLRTTYNDTMTEMVKLYSATTTAVAAYLEKQQDTTLAETLEKARAITQAMLPLATSVSVDASVADQIAKPSPKTAASQLAKLTGEFLPANHAPLSIEPRLTNFWPRNELELLPDMLYQFSETPLDDIKAAVASWPISRKQDALLAYVQNHASDKATVLHAFRYTWDILCDYRMLQDFIRVGASITSQTFTPRFGYTIPPEVEAAGMTEQFERCFDLSLELHSQLVAAKAGDEAQLAILAGHKQRFMITLNAVQLRELPLASEVVSVATKLLDATKEVHPLLHSEQS